ncbi:MAG TPA: Ig-like domain-containing protein, partial [Candidatus Krumholzibacterium sp.]|nr:Ig-like domain-containing protein [Candidatus Krumholzibacterium sp.]
VDVTPPYLLWVSVTSPYRLRLAFSEPVTTESMMDTANYSIFDTADPSTVFEIVEITRNAADKATIDIDGPLQEEHPYSLTIVGIEDISGLVIEPPGITTGFLLEDTSAPAMISASATSDSTVMVVFSELMDGVTAEDPSNYEVFETDYPLVTIPVVSATAVEPGDTVLLGLGSKLPRGISFTARATGVYDYHENVIGFPNFAEFILPDDMPPGLAGIALVSQGVLQLRFDEPVSEATAENTGNYTLFPTGSPGTPIVISEISLRSDGIEATLTLQSFLSTGVDYTLQVSNVEDLSGNPIPPGSEIVFTALDERRPILMSVSVIDSMHLELTYNEPLDPVSATGLSNYSVYEEYTPANTVAVASAGMPSAAVVTVGLGSELISGVPYMIEISGVEDLAGNQILPGTKRGFTYVTENETARIGLFADADHLVNCVQG